MHDDETLLILSKTERELLYMALTRFVLDDANDDEKTVAEEVLQRLEKEEQHAPS